MYKTQALSFDTRVRTFWTLAFLAVASLAIYVYGINATVRNTVARQNLEAEAANISTHLGEMEFAYIGLKNKVSLDVAYERGYQNVTSPTFISRVGSRSLSLNTVNR
jgi:hypothetical protein